MILTCLPLYPPKRLIGLIATPRVDTHLREVQSMQDFDIFELFPKLPLELRLKILKETFVPRTVTLRVNLRNKLNYLKQTELTSSPVTLWISQESLSETVCKYKVLFATVLEFPIYISPRLDSIRVCKRSTFSPTLLSSKPYSLRFSTRWVTKVPKVAVSHSP